MSIEWTAKQRREVEECLARNPANSGNCLEVARGILPIGQEQDVNARPWKLRPRPGQGRFVVPKVSVGNRWFHHFTVEAVEHCVDALTGPDGTQIPGYLAEHWRYSEALELVDTSLTENEP